MKRIYVLALYGTVGLTLGLPAFALSRCDLASAKRSIFRFVEEFSGLQPILQDHNYPRSMFSCDVHTGAVLHIKADPQRAKSGAFHCLGIRTNDGTLRNRAAVVVGVYEVNRIEVPVREAMLGLGIVIHNDNLNPVARTPSSPYRTRTAQPSANIKTRGIYGR